MGDVLLYGACLDARNAYKKGDHYVDLSVVVRIVLILNLKIRSVRMLTGFNRFRLWFGGAAYMNAVLNVCFPYEA
jgi:hypothetical protein